MQILEVSVCSWKKERRWVIKQVYISFVVRDRFIFGVETYVALDQWITHSYYYL